MKKMLKVFGVMVLGAIALSGCGTSGKKTLEVFSTKPESINTLKELAEQFAKEKNDGTVVTVVSPADAGTVLRARLAKNDIPDVIMMGGDSNYTEFASSGVLLDLTDTQLINNVQENYLKMIYDINADKSKKAFAIPYATNASGVLYNKALFRKAGVSIPETWTEFMDVIAKLKKAGIQPFELTFLDSWTCLPPWNSMAPVIAPASFTEDRRNGKTTFAATHREVLEKYLTILKNSQGSDFMGTSYDDGNKKFAQGGAAMMINGNWAISEFIKNNPDIEVDLFAFPSTDNPSKNTLTSGIDVCIAIAAKSKQSELAKEFASFLVRKDVAQQYVNEQFAFSAVKDVKQNNKTVEGVKATIAAGRVSDFPDHYYPSGYDLASVLSKFALNYANKMDDEKNISETLAECDRQYDAVNDR
jgi:raffinose/stachyose/melibiose transport system substrate-binding protein